MSFTQNNFLIQLKNVITGQSNGAGSGVGFVRSYPIPLHDLRTSGGLTLTAATNPLVAALETNHAGVQWAASDSSAAVFNFVVPYDYDKNSDVLTVALLANSAGNTDSPILDATVYKKRALTALSADLDPTASAAIAKAASPAAVAAERTIVLSGKGIKAGDILTFKIVPGAHTTDAVNLYGLSIRYKSTLVAYDPSLR